MQINRFLFSFLFFFLFMGTYVMAPAKAASTAAGIFVEAVYQNVQLDDGTNEKVLTGIVIQNSQGRKITLNIDSSAKLTIDTLPVTMDAFKSGMKIQAVVNMRRVKELKGQSAEHPGAIDPKDRVLTGTVNRIDPNGRFLSLKLDSGLSKTYYLNQETEVFKETSLVDLSALYEGDRVKLSFSSYNSNYIRTIDVNTEGIKIEHLYKGTIQQIDPIRRKLVVKQEKVFQDWKWKNTPISHNSYTYSPNTIIYSGNRLIERDQIRHYQNQEVYFVTVRQFGREIVEKMIIRSSNERTFYEPMSSVNTPGSKITLKDSGPIPYHKGTILIRNGRLVEASSLPFKGTAFIVTDGGLKSEYANIVHITNDGFQSPNLTNHAIYFGQVGHTNGYSLTLKNARILSSNKWIDTMPVSLSFSNTTTAVRDFGTDVLSVIPQQNEIKSQIGKYGYFYVANNQIVGMHLVELNTPVASIISAGRIEEVNSVSKKIKIRNVSQWKNGAWDQAGNIFSMDIKQTTIIRDGRVISSKDLKAGDRLYFLHESTVKGRLLLAD